MFRINPEDDDINSLNDVLTFVIICVELMGLIVTGFGLWEFFTFDMNNWRK